MSGLGDPFAEIFAAISIADSPTASVVPVSDTPSEHEPAEDASVVESKSDDDEADDEPQASIDVKSELAFGQAEQANVPQVTTDESVTLDQESEQPTAVSQKSLGTEPSDNEPGLTDAEVGTVSVEADPEDPGAVVDAEMVVVASQSGEREKSDSDAEVVVEPEASVDASNANDDVPNANDDVPEVKTSNQSDWNPQDSEPDGEADTDSSHAVKNQGNVERRRYSSQQSGGNSGNGNSDQPTGESQQSSETVANQRGSVSAASKAGSPIGGGSGIDISSLTPVTPTPAASVAAGITPAAVASTAAKAASSAAGIAKSVTGNAATGTASTSTSNAADSASTPEIDASLKTGTSGSSTKGTESKATAGTDTLSAVQRAKLVQRVSRGFQHLGAGGGQIRMRLSPHELGAVQLQMSIQDGQLSGQMITETEAASQALREQLPQLRGALESQGIHLERLDILTESASDSMDADLSGQRFGDTSGQSGSNAFTQRQDQAESRQRAGWSGVRATAKESTTVTASVSRGATQPQSGVDLTA